MATQLLDSDVAFASNSIVDSAGRVFRHGERVFRAVYSEERAAFCRRLLAAEWMEDAFRGGLVRTWVATDVELRGARLVLEHEPVSLSVFPAEFTSRMLWSSAKTLAGLSRLLARHGVFVKDAHPWNFMFSRGRPIFVDFGSLENRPNSKVEWLEEFRKYFGVPIWLGSWGLDRFARECRREHAVGFGTRLFDSRPLRWAGLASLGLRCLGSRPEQLFEGVERWVDSHRPSGERLERWADYRQSGDTVDPSTPMTGKQQFVLDVLCREKPRSVLDCAANKGFYSAMAARLGASVAAFDYEEYCVDASRALALDQSLDVTPALMDFRFPTPASGWGLSYPDAYERFRSELLLALGLIHHLCITQGFPVRLFCEMCAKYSTRGIVLEFVHPTDRHVAAWRKPIPADYTIDAIAGYLSGKYPRRVETPWRTEDGVDRTMLHFHA